MDGQPEYDKELNLTNTPLENLKSILSDADASVQATPAAPKLSQPGLSKEDMRKAVETLKALPEALLPVEKVRQILGLPAQPSQAGSRAVFENRHVISLEKWLQYKSY